jgi:Fe-S cluster assembly protein SufD
VATATATIARWIDARTEPDWLLDMRRRAAALEAATPLPRWDRTDIAGLDPDAFAAPQGAVEVHLPEAARAAGVDAGPIADIAARHPEAVRSHLGRVVEAGAGKFEARNLAAHQGCAVLVPARVELAEPLEISYRMPDTAGGQFHPRILIVVGEAARVRLWLRSEGGPTKGAGQALVTHVVEAWVGDRANLQFTEVQGWGDGVTNVTARGADVAADARIEWLIGELGGGLSRSGTRTHLRGAGGEALSLALFFPSAHQHMDILATLVHDGRRTDGLMLARGVLSGWGRAVYRGTSDIHRGARDCNSQQKESALHLSPHVRSDAIPALYIQENEVQAGHAATTGKVDPEQMFYLTSRGLPRREAERLIVHGFFAPLLERIPLEAARDQLVARIDAKIDDGEQPALTGGR